jgi:hypothetical protein
MTEDVTILYQGGSGGFALYYYLLLTGRFQHSIEETWDRIHYQFPTKLIDDPGIWKTRELRPDNHALKQTAGPNLFLVCNPFWGDYYRSIPDGTYKILLYADLRLQLRMAWDKRAWWFTDETRNCSNAPDNNLVYIRQIIRDSGVFDSVPVDPKVNKIIQHYMPEKIVNLKDFVRNKNIRDVPNHHQLKFLNHWTGLQTKKALHLLHL